MVGRISNKKFQGSIEYCEKVLRQAYLNAIEATTDPHYAKQHFQNQYFTKSEMVPYQTILFHELKISYHHYSRLKKSTVLKELYNVLPVIREISKKCLDGAIKHHNGDKTALLHDLYIQQLRNGTATHNELIEIE